MTRPTKRRAALAGAAVAVGACLHGWVSVPEVAAQGAVGGHALSGPVDSEIARDYLEGRPLPDELAAIRGRLLGDARAPSREELAEIARRFSPDVATLLFLETVGADPDNRALRRRFERALDHVRAEGIERTLPHAPPDLLVMLVPGWFYRSHGKDSGADLARQRSLLDRMGIAHRLVEVDENGAVGNNARLVAQAVRRASADHRILLVSASKGSPEVAHALGRELAPEETRAVVGWVNIGGVVRGTPFADRVLEPDLCWLAKVKLGLDGFDLDGAKSLQTAPSRDAFEALRLPPNVPITSYVATPLSGHVTGRGAFGYSQLRDHGPNDGLTLLVDELVPGATTLLAPGVDHFFEHEEQDTWTAALLRVLLQPLTETT